MLARYRALFPTQSRFDALCDTGFSGALNRQTTDMQRLLPLRIGPSRALWALIGLQTNAGSRQFVRGGFPLGNHREKIVSFLSDAGHFGAFGWHEPLLSRRAHPVSDVWMQDNSASCMHQIKSDSALVYQHLPGLDLVCPESLSLYLTCDRTTIAAVQQHYHAERAEEWPGEGHGTP